MRNMNCTDPEYFLINDFKDCKDDFCLILLIVKKVVYLILFLMT